MSKPIPAVVCTPPSVRPRRYVAVANEPNSRGDCSTTVASIEIPSPSKDGTVFMLPGSEEVWTKERVQEAAKKMRDDGCYDMTILDDGYDIDLARLLGVLPEATKP